MSKNKSGNYLYIFYKKKADSFLTNLNKASISWNVKDIHHIRINIKKIRAIFQLLEMVKPKKFKANRYYKIFKDLFKHTGMIRETQINLIYINQYNLISSGVLPFKKSLKENENKLKNEFKVLSNKFNIEKFIAIGEVIKKLCEDINQEKFTNKCKGFIIKEAKTIQKLHSNSHSPNEIHKIRKHFKSLGAIAVLLNNFKPEKQLKKFLGDLKNFENLLGIWHDRIVLLETVEKFFKINEIKTGNKSHPLKSLAIQITKENNELLKKLNPEVNPILYNIM